MPRGPGFIAYEVFDQGYEALKRATENFRSLSESQISDVIQRLPVALIVVRAILGFTPPEWAYLSSQHAGTFVSQGFPRSLDRKIRLKPLKPLKITGATAPRLQALVTTACHLLQQGVPDVPPDSLHRLNKADTQDGLPGVKNLADLGVPYSMLLYERFLGRPFAGHRDSVSELVGDSLEVAIEEVLLRHGISYQKTKRAERIPGFDQAPDFMVPSKLNPLVIIEAKITEDDGTARD